MLTHATATTLPSGTTIHFVGTRGSDAWVIEHGPDALLVDTGQPYSAAGAVAAANAALDGRRPAAILLTHSHYDHVGGLAAYREAFPYATVCASAGTAKVFRSEGAKAQMRALNESAAKTAGRPTGPDFTGGLHVDRVLKEGDRVDAGALSAVVWETPGHTNDCLSFYFPQADALFSSESTGVYGIDLSAGDGASAIRVEPTAIVSWKKPLAVLDRIAAQNPAVLVIPHSGVLTGARIGEFMDKERAAILFAKDLVFRRTKEGRSPEEIVLEFKSLYFDRRPGRDARLQPADAFLANFTAMVPRFLAEGA